LVAGGAVTQGSIDELTSTSIRYAVAASMQRIMIIEATGDQNAADNEGRIPPPKVELKPLIRRAPEDATFLEYDKSTSWTRFGVVPPAAAVPWRSQDHTHATAKSVIRSCRESGVRPERQRFDDIINRKVLRPTSRNSGRSGRTRRACPIRTR
jgi:capsid portal protein